MIVDASMDNLVQLANQFAAEHVNIQVKDEAKVLPRDRTAYLNHCLEAAGER